MPSASLKKDEDSPLSETAGSVVIELPPRMDSNAFTKLHLDFLGARDRNLTIQAENVEMLGARCAELLLNVSHHWAAAGHLVRVLNPSRSMEEHLGRFGLTTDDLDIGDTQ